MRQRLAQLLLEKSYLEGEFTLTSGKKSEYYFDCKPTALHPEGAYLLGRLLVEELRRIGPVDGVAGMTLGADPLVSAVTVVSYLEGMPLPGIIVRKSPKGHGTNRYLEGLANFAPGARVALLEDVVTTGGTLLTTAERVRAEGLEVAAVVCVLDREEGGRQRLAEAGYRLHALFTRQELKALGQGAT